MTPPPTSSPTRRGSAPLALPQRRTRRHHQSPRHRTLEHRRPRRPPGRLHRLADRRADRPARRDRRYCLAERATPRRRCRRTPEPTRRHRPRRPTAPLPGRLPTGHHRSPRLRHQDDRVRHPRQRCRSHPSPCDTHPGRRHRALGHRLAGTIRRLDDQAPAPARTRHHYLTTIPSRARCRQGYRSPECRFQSVLACCAPGEREDVIAREITGGGVPACQPRGRGDVGTRKRKWVTSASSTRRVVCSGQGPSSARSNSRAPVPSSRWTRWILISPTSPAFTNWRPRLAPPMSTTSRPLAAVRACASTLSIPPETNVNVLPPGSAIGS